MGASCKVGLDILLGDIRQLRTDMEAQQAKRNQKTEAIGVLVSAMEGKRGELETEREAPTHLDPATRI